jgi:hypothetical protein
MSRLCLNNDGFSIYDSRIASHCRMTDAEIIRKDSEGSGHGLMEVLFP